MSEQRLIDADALLEDIQREETALRTALMVSAHNTEICNNSRTRLSEILSIEHKIKYAPTVERPRGEWIKTFRCKGENINTGAISSLYYYDCSKCKYRTGNQGKEFYFCPNCGADMRGEEE